VVRDGQFVHVAMGSLSMLRRSCPTEHIFVARRRRGSRSRTNLPAVRRAPT
jgi:hypothetical protein